MSPLVIPFWDCPPADACLLGVDFLDRIARQSRRAGFGEVIVRPGPDAIRKLPERFLIVFPNLLLSDRGWKRLHSLEADCDTLTALSTSDSIALIRSKDADLIRAAFAASRNYQELLARLRSRLRSDTWAWQVRIRLFLKANAIERTSKGGCCAASSRILKASCPDISNAGFPLRSPEGWQRRE